MGKIQENILETQQNEPRTVEVKEINPNLPKIEWVQNGKIKLPIPVHLHYTNYFVQKFVDQEKSRECKKDSYIKVLGQEHQDYRTIITPGFQDFMYALLYTSDSITFENYIMKTALMKGFKVRLVSDNKSLKRDFK